MLTSIIISIITIIALIISIIFIPSMKIKKVEFQTFWIVAIVGALLIILTKCITVEDAISTIIDKKGINPIEILILFISMSILTKLVSLKPVLIMQQIFLKKAKLNYLFQ